MGFDNFSESGVLQNSVLFSGTVPPNSVLFGEIVPPNSFPLIGEWYIHVHPTLNIVPTLLCFSNLGMVLNMA